MEGSARHDMLTGLRKEEIKRAGLDDVKLCGGVAGFALDSL
jgi:hypothetical protein